MCAAACHASPPLHLLLIPFAINVLPLHHLLSALHPFSHSFIIVRVTPLCSSLSSLLLLSFLVNPSKDRAALTSSWLRYQPQLPSLLPADLTLTTATRHCKYLAQAFLPSFLILSPSATAITAASRCLHLDRFLSPRSRISSPIYPRCRIRCQHQISALVWFDHQYVPERTRLISPWIMSTEEHQLTRI